MAQQVAEYPSPSPLAQDATPPAAPTVPPGDYATTRRTFQVPFTLQPKKGSAAQTLTLPVVVTLPENPTTAWPVVVLFNGFQVPRLVRSHPECCLLVLLFPWFIWAPQSRMHAHLHATRACASADSTRPRRSPQCRAHYYQHIADYIASRGFAVLQYTTPLLRIIPDRDELPFLGQLLGWVAAAQRDEGAVSEGARFLGRGVDLTRVCVTGHSRGAKLAALHYAANADIAAAALIDPVNNTTYTQESEEYPDACKALHAAGRPVGIIGGQAVAVAGSWSFMPAVVGVVEGWDGV
jgi:hypothetical protein